MFNIALEWGVFLHVRKDAASERPGLRSRRSPTSTGARQPPSDGCSEREARRLGVVEEHLDGVERELVEVLADQRQLLQQVVGHGDHMAADRVGLEEVEQLPRAGPDQLRDAAGGAATSQRSSMIGSGSRPVSAMRPANTET